MVSDEGQAAFAAPISGDMFFSVRKSRMQKIVTENMRRGIDLTPMIKTMSFGRAYDYRVKPGVDWNAPWGEAIGRIYDGQSDVMPAMKQVKPVLDALLRKAHR